MLAGIRYTECSGPPIGNGLVVRVRDDRWVSGALGIVVWVGGGVNLQAVLLEPHLS